LSLPILAGYGLKSTVLFNAFIKIQIFKKCIIPKEYVIYLLFSDFLYHYEVPVTDKLSYCRHKQKCRWSKKMKTRLKQKKVIVKFGLCRWICPISETLLQKYNISNNQTTKTP